MIEKSLFHPALLKKWGVDAQADFILPITILGDAVAGVFDLSVTATDLADNEASTSSGSGVSIKVLDKRDKFNLYLMPGANFISPAIECTGSDCTGADFDIDALISETVENAAAGIDTLDEVIENVFWYCPLGGSTQTPALCTLGQESSFLVNDAGAGADDFASMRAGRGYVVVTDSASFLTESYSAQGLVDTPVPMKVTLEGAVVADAGAALSSVRVLQEWNLVGPHSAGDTLVGSFLAGAEYLGEPLWVIMHTFTNSVDIKLTSDGIPQRDAQGVPLTEAVLGVFESNVPFGQGPNSVISGGSGSWLYMCTTPLSPCTAGVSLPPILD
jgi:hypothetical protein